MPPKKSASKTQTPSRGPKTKSGADSIRAKKEGTSKDAISKKRKNAAETNGPQKEPRRSGRGTSKPPSQEQLLRYMLSAVAEDLCRPDEESEAVKLDGKTRTYSSALNPFEELLCAVILSRPISHRLGLRSIRTILNEPYNFTSARATKDAGEKQHHQALWDAKTQHKQKTAEQIGQIANIVLDKFTASGDKDGTQLQKVLDDSGGDIDEALDTLREDIKGLGGTGLNIFLRRVQWMWSAASPYIDDRTMLSLRKLGLPEEGEELEKVMEKYWNKVDKKVLAGGDEKAKKRRAFVIVLDRAIGADLEGKGDALLQAAVEAA